MCRKKKTQENELEFTAQREATIEEVIKKLRIQGLTMENKKNELFKKLMEARQKGFKSQEEQARGLMRRCMAMQRQASGMLMTLELAVQARDVTLIIGQFLECIGAISQDIIDATNKADFKTTQKKYLKAMYAFKTQSAKLDELLALGEYAGNVAEDSELFSEFNHEIDLMIKQAELDYGAQTDFYPKTQVE